MANVIFEVAMRAFLDVTLETRPIKRSWAPFWGVTLENKLHEAVMGTVLGRNLGKRVP
ncbi:hypothetical protein [Cytobacillus depressus]|uniref:hypothetical protein n=1 Tax=Cytobacillus depressus TaxID=1602942 RepID=UPI001478672C|nr:hypothetical protein [Cytobacillus depressus]